MTKEKYDNNPSIQNAMGNLKQRFGNTPAASIKSSMNNATIADPSAAQFAIGDEIYIPEDEKFLFAQQFAGGDQYGVIVGCTTASGTECAKSLYFRALNRSVPEYSKTTFQSTGVIIEAKTDAAHAVYDEANKYAIIGQLYEAFKGKTLKVVELLPVEAARYDRSGNITGTRTRRIPVFDFVVEKKK